MFSDDQKWAGFPYFSRYSSHHLARLKKFYFSFLFFILILVWNMYSILK